MSSTVRKGKTRKAGTRPGRAIDKAALVNRLLNSIERRLEKDELKATLGDFIRLLQLQKELEDEEPREIEVRWVEPEPVSANER
jgi:hypothetical protein